MTTIFCVLNQKGGTGKSSTVQNVGASLSLRGSKVLLIDLDAQSNLTQGSGIKGEDIKVTLSDVLKGADINKSILHTKSGYDIIPTTILQSGIEIELSNVTGREYLLKEALEGLQTAYDYIICDCPPSLSIIPLMALTASNYVIVPCDAGFYALQGLSQLKNTIQVVKKRLNPSVEILGVVLTKFDERRNLDTQVRETIKKAFGDKLFSTTISQNVAIAEAPVYGKSIFDYAPESKGSLQYVQLTNEILLRL